MTDPGKTTTSLGFPRTRQSGLTRRSFVSGATAFGALAIGSRAAAQQDPPIIEPTGPTPAAPGVPIEQEQSPLETDEVSTGEIEQVAEETSGEYFVRSGHNLSEPFLAPWRQAGGEEVLGIPLSESRFVDDTGLIEQVFEGIILAWDPELDAAESIQGKPLGTARVNALSSQAARRSTGGCGPSESTCQFFPETGHTVSGVLAMFWNSRGGAPLFGLPLSEPERSGSTLTQVFEKVVLNVGANGAVTAETIGIDIVEEQGLASDPAFLPAPPTLGTSTLVTASDGLRLRSGPSTDDETIVVLADNAEFIAVSGATGEWIPGYADGYSGYVAAEFLQSSEQLPTVNVGGNWDTSVWQGAALSETNLRAEPTTESRIIETIPYGAPVIAVDWVKGEQVDDGSDTWAQLEDGTYLFERNVGRAGPVLAPPVSGDAPTQGNWIDCNLTQQLLVAYEGRTPVRVAVQTTGKPGWETPEGYYVINTRVANETMESGSIGADEFYKLENVLFTQYFTDRGHALHFAWWKTPETIGRPGSHGCLNLLLDDAEFFWNWAGIGTPVYSHY